MAKGRKIGAKTLPRKNVKQSRPFNPNHVTFPTLVEARRQAREAIRQGYMHDGIKRIGPDLYVIIKLRRRPLRPSKETLAFQRRVKAAGGDIFAPGVAFGPDVRGE